MKGNVAWYVLVLMLAVVVSCGKKEEKASEEEAALLEWKELDDFHMVMAEVFHPLKDSGNVQPIMERAGELADAAEKLATSPLPEKVNNDDVKKMLEELKTGTRQLATDIADGGEEDMAGTRLHELHELFHHIHEAWSSNGAEAHEGHEGHH